MQSKNRRTGNAIKNSSLVGALNALRELEQIIVQYL